MIDDDGAFLGVRPEIQAAIGRVVIAAGQMDWLTGEMLLALSLPTGGASLASTTRLIVKTATESPPLWSRCDTAGLAGWAQRVRDTMDRRNDETHSGRFHKRVDDDWHPAKIFVRTGDAKAVDLAEIDSVAEELVTLLREGYAFLFSLLPEIKPGAYLRRRGDFVGLFLSGDGIPNFAPPTDAEIAAATKASYDIDASPHLDSAESYMSPDYGTDDAS